MRDLMATLSRVVVASGPSSCLWYFAGALRDGTFSSKHRTWRLAQKDKDWLLVVRVVLDQLGAKSWIYREGKDRSVWVLETCCRPSDFSPLLQSSAENAAFVRGYFDAEGGIPQGALLASTFNLPRRTGAISRSCVNECWTSGWCVGAFIFRVSPLIRTIGVSTFPPLVIDGSTRR